MSIAVVVTAPAEPLAWAGGVDCSTLVTVDALDAALAALTGVMALDGSFSTVGDPAEGVIVLPVPDLPSAPLTRVPTRAPAATQAGTDETGVARPAEAGERTCRCGCGALVRRRFLPGHDAKLEARLLRLQADGPRRDGATARAGIDDDTP